jgi:purine-binding chemotaxis protein CheW
MTTVAARGTRGVAAEHTRPEDDAMQIVTFRIGGEFFAADVQAVERVLRYQPATPLPEVPPWVAGVLEYQQRVVPVIDLRVRFEVAGVSPTTDTRIIVFNTAAGWTAGVVDAVLDVSAVERNRLEAPPPLLNGLSAEYLHGIARRDGQLVLLLNADRVLSSTDERLLQTRIAEMAPARRGARRV